MGFILVGVFSGLDVWVLITAPLVGVPGVFVGELEGVVGRECPGERRMISSKIFLGPTYSKCIFVFCREGTGREKATCFFDLEVWRLMQSSTRAMKPVVTTTSARSTKDCLRISRSGTQKRSSEAGTKRPRARSSIETLSSSSGG